MRAMFARRSRLAFCALAALLAACGRSPPSGPVRTAMQASEIAQDALRSAGLDEEIIDCRRENGSWLVVTRWPQTSMAGHLVTVDAATGKAKMERYRSIELTGPRFSAR
jgi:hypothetical protein